MYEVKALQANTPDYTKDLTELELHTTRIYELVISDKLESKDLEREKALVELERTYQAKLQAQNDKYNDKVDEMHVENERIRQNYESRLKNFNKDNLRQIVH